MVGRSRWRAQKRAIASAAILQMLYVSMKCKIRWLSPRASVSGEGSMAVGLVDRGRRALQERTGDAAMEHELARAAGVAVEVGPPVVRLHHREIEDVVEVVGQLRQVAVDQVERHAVHPCLLEGPAGLRIAESGRWPTPHCLRPWRA